MIAELDTVATADKEREILELKLALQMVQTNLTVFAKLRAAMGQPAEPLIEDASRIIRKAL